MNYPILRAEIASDPLERYDGLTPQQIADSLNTVNRPRNRSSMTGSEVLNAVDVSEWGTRSDVQKQVIWDIVHLGTVDPFGVEQDLLVAAFADAGGVTIAALGEARVEAISRAVELGIGQVKTGHVERMVA